MTRAAAVAVLLAAAAALAGCADTDESAVLPACEDDANESALPGDGAKQSVKETVECEAAATPVVGDA